MHTIPLPSSLTPEQQAYNAAMYNDPAVKAARDAIPMSDDFRILRRVADLEDDIENMKFFKDNTGVSDANKGKTLKELKQQLAELKSSPKYVKATKTINAAETALQQAVTTYQSTNPPPASPQTSPKTQPSSLATPGTPPNTSPSSSGLFQKQPIPTMQSNLQPTNLAGVGGLYGTGGG
jgi:hypothetical protein